MLPISPDIGPLFSPEALNDPTALAYRTAIVTGGLVCPATLRTTDTCDPGATPDGTTTLI